MNVIATALYSRLATANTAAGTKIYRNRAPEAAVYPYAVFSIQAGGPLNITPSDMRELVYYVRAYGTTANQAGTIDAQISAILHHGTLAITGYTNYFINREQDVELVETTPAGAAIFSAGALYRIAIDG